MVILLYILIGLQALDFYSTYRVINGKIGRELNPVVSWLITKLGLVRGLAVAKGVAVAVAYGLYIVYPLVLIPLIAFYGYVVYNNFKIKK